MRVWNEFVLAREVSMEELAEIRRNTDIQIEAFIHGAMCISYSGRCTLSNHMSMRDAKSWWVALNLVAGSMNYSICLSLKNIVSLTEKW